MYFSDSPSCVGTAVQELKLNSDWSVHLQMKYKQGRTPSGKK